MSRSESSAPVRGAVAGWRAQLREDWRAYERLLSFTRPYRLRLAVGAVCCAVFAGSTGGILLSVRKIFERVFNPLEHSLAAVISASLLLVLFGVLRGLGDYAGRYLIEWVGSRVVMDVRNVRSTACWACPSATSRRAARGS